MRSLARLRPSPAMAVALLALFIALGGVSYAVATIDSSDIVNGSIKSKDIKNQTIGKADVKLNTLVGKNLLNDTVRTEDIRNGTIESIDVANGSLNTLDVANGSLFGLDVFNNSLTGLDINEATLGQVNSAANAATVSTVRTIPLTTINEAGGSTPLATVGPFTILAECISNAGTNTSLFIRIDTSEDDGSVGVHSNIESDANFDSTDGAKAIAEANDVPGGFPTGTHPDGTGDNLPEGPFNAFAPSGTALTGHVAGWVDASAGASGQCKIHGSMVVS